MPAAVGGAGRAPLGCRARLPFSGFSSSASPRRGESSRPGHIHSLARPAPGREHVPLPAGPGCAGPGALGSAPRETRGRSSQCFKEAVGGEGRRTTAGARLANAARCRRVVRRFKSKEEVTGQSSPRLGCGWEGEILLTARVSVYLIATWLHVPVEEGCR